MRKLFLTVLAAVGFCALASTANAQTQHVGGKYVYACTGHETPRLAHSTPSSGTCHCAREVAVGSNCSGTIVNGNPVGTTVVQTPLPDDMIVVHRDDFKRIQRPDTPPAPAPQVSSASVPTGGVRVFTANVSIANLAEAFKANAKSDVLNAPTAIVMEGIKKTSGVDVTPENIFAGQLVDCQRNHVAGKRRVGVFSHIKPMGDKNYGFAPTGLVMNECQSGQKVYVVEGVAIADSSGFLLAPKAYVGD